MKRTQIYMDEETYKFLEKESSLENRTVSEVIRNGLKEIAQRKSRDIIEKSNKVFGIWKKRRFDTNRYIRKLRRNRKHGNF